MLKEQLNPFPQSDNKGAKEEKDAILASLKWGEGWSRCSIYFVQDWILDGKKGTIIINPLPPKSNESAKEQTPAILASLKWGGGGGPDVPFILSKIVARNSLDSYFLWLTLWNEVQICI